MFSVIQRLNDRRQDVGEDGEDAGFTLIELMVVLLILAILLAIAIPTFLGVTKSANDRAAQSNLNSALTNVKSYFQQNSQSYTTAATLVATMATQEPSLQWTTGNSTSSGPGQRVRRLPTVRASFWLTSPRTGRTAGTPWTKRSPRQAQVLPTWTWLATGPRPTLPARSTECRRTPRPATLQALRPRVRATCSRAKASRRAHKQGLTADRRSLSGSRRESECAPLHVEGGTFLPDPSVLAAPSRRVSQRCGSERTDRPW